MSEQNTHFGYKTIPSSQKTEKVASVFHSVAKRYDIMNDLMSFGLHRLWKRIAVSKCALKPHHSVLDLAGGTGDLTRLLAKELSKEGQIVLADINSSMMSVGRDRLINEGIIQPIQWVQANAETLPFSSESFDCVIMAFGLRNVTHKEKALAEIFRTLKWGGRAVILEFSHPTHPFLSSVYDAYSFSALPLMGELVCQDRESYQYLAESIRMHPNQECLKDMMIQVGFQNARYDNIHQGIVAIHMGFKLS
jgi:demethylmenaquinone methyltransferase / 2-methoxy-6-polyprenyl-1,4-benzoquinol methylase